MPHVLIVGDSGFLREGICDSLTLAGLDCEAADGKEARSAFENRDVGAVVLDLELKAGEPLELVRRLRERRPEVGLIVVASHSGQERVLEAMRLGAHDYLAKPLHDEELLLSLQRALAGFRDAARARRLREGLDHLNAALDLFDEQREEAGDDALPEQLSQLVSQTLGAAKTSLLTLDPDSQRLRLTAMTGRTPPAEAYEEIALGEGAAGRAAASGEAFCVADVVEDKRFRQQAEGRYASRSFAVAPLRSAGELRGVVCATDLQGGRAFDDDDLILLRVLAQQMAPLLERAATPAEIEAAPEPEPEPEPEPTPEVASAAPREGDAELARQICAAVSQELEPDRLLEAVLRPIETALGAGPVSVYLRNSAGDELVCEAQRDAGVRSDRPSLPVGRGLTGLVLETGQLVATEAPGADARFDAEVDTPESGEVAPLLCVPITFRQRPMGVLRAFLLESVRPSVRTGEVLAAAVSAAVRNVLLYRSLVQSMDDVARIRREVKG